MKSGGGDFMNKKQVSSTWFLLSWLAFIVCLVTVGIGIYNLGMPLSVQGLFMQSVIVIVITSLNLQKTLTDKDDGVKSVTSQWLLFSWGAFLLGVITFGISIYNLDAALSVKGFYSQSLMLIVLTTVNLQKVTMERDKNSSEVPFTHLITKDSDEEAE